MEKELAPNRHLCVTILLIVICCLPTKIVSMQYWQSYAKSSFSNSTLDWFQHDTSHGFNITFGKNNLVNVVIGYLDCLDAPGTAMFTIYYMTGKLLHIKDRLNLKSSNLCQAYQIKCKKYDKFKDFFLVIGTFQIIHTLLAVIASRFKDAGLGDVLVQSNIVVEGSVDTI